MLHENCPSQHFFVPLSHSLKKNNKNEYNKKMGMATFVRFDLRSLWQQTS
jgi:hypothetical protein